MILSVSKTKKDDFSVKKVDFISLKGAKDVFSAKKDDFDN